MLTKQEEDVSIGIGSIDVNVDGAINSQIQAHQMQMQIEQMRHK